MSDLPNDKREKWTVRQGEDGQQRVCSSDFTHDVEMIVTGDFRDANQSFEYALGICDKLNALPSATRTLPSEPQDWPELGDVAGPPNEPAALVAWISTAQTHGADELVRRMQKRLLLWEKAHLPPDVYERINGWPIYVGQKT